MGPRYQSVRGRSERLHRATDDARQRRCRQRAADRLVPRDMVRARGGAVRIAGTRYKILQDCR